MNFSKFRDENNTFSFFIFYFHKGKKGKIELVGLHG